MNTIEFTDNELQILIQLLDISVKAQGLNVAEAAIVLAKKITTVAQQPVEPVEPVEPIFAEPTLVPEEDSSEEDSE